ncbi:MAG: PilZ domain-containing protein [Bacillota bacterium]
MSARSSKKQKPRELRRRVIVPARLRHGASWSDACILNISSRGLMIHTGRPLNQGTEVEIRRGDHVIVARVVWRDGGRAGLCAEDRVPVEEIVTLGQSPALRVTASLGERRKEPRPDEASRHCARVMEFAGVLAVTAALAVAGLMMVRAAFAEPLGAVAAVLG